MKIKRAVNKRRIAFVLFCALVVLVGGYIAVSQMRVIKKDAQTNTVSSKTPIKSTASVPSKSIRVAAMGDMLAHDSVVKQAKTQNGYDFTPYFSNIKPLYNGADVVFCNPETLAAGAAFGVSGYPAFNAPTEFTRDLRTSGCNLINLATNHIGDKNQAAMNATIDGWEAQKPLAVAGANRNATEQQTVKYFEKNGLKCAFVAFADFSNNTAVAKTSLNLYHDKALVEKLLTEARKNADVVIVSAHWGTEDFTAVNADQKEAAQLFSSLGADVIIGTGPHVLQKVSSIKRTDGGSTLVWYSIGNMLSSQLQTNELTGGIAGFTITKENGKIAIKDLTFNATFMSYDWSASDKAAGNLLARSNLSLTPLAKAADGTAKHGTTVAERTQFVHQTLGSEVPIAITP